MKDVLDEALNAIRSGWRFRWYAILLAWVTAMVGWGFIYMMPNKYEANTRVYVDTKSVLKPLLKGLAVETDIREQLGMITKTLLSRPNIESVIRETDLDLQVKSEAELDDLVRTMMKKISIRGGGRNKNLFSITYMHENPETAKQVVQELLSIFVESSIGDERKEANTATQFLSEQIASYETKLLAAEKRLTDFKRKNVGMLPGTGGDVFQRLEASKKQHEDAILALKEGRNLRDELNKQMHEILENRGAQEEKEQVSNNFDNPYMQRIQILEQKLDELLLKYTDQHPDVAEIKSKIVILQERLDKEEKKIDADKAKYQQPSNVAVMGQNLALDQLKLQLATAEASYASIKIREKSYREKVDEATILMDTIPQVEAELTRLNRDYNINKQNYETLTQRRESAEMSKDVDEAGDSVKFRIIDPPHVPSFPASPNRKLLSAAILLVAFSLGAALAFLLSKLKPVFYGTSELRRETEFPVFGSVSRVWTSNLRTKRKIEVTFFIVSSLMLLFMFAALEVMYFVGGADKLVIALRGLI
jgi:polysaccharide chain length determinant protein (PEP-CTERM system associated)